MQISDRNDAYSVQFSHRRHDILALNTNLHKWNWCKLCTFTGVNLGSDTQTKLLQWFTGTNPFISASSSGNVCCVLCGLQQFCVDVLCAPAAYFFNVHVLSNVWRCFQYLNIFWICNSLSCQGHHRLRSYVKICTIRLRNTNRTWCEWLDYDVDIKLNNTYMLHFTLSCGLQSRALKTTWTEPFVSHSIFKWSLHPVFRLGCDFPCCSSGNYFWPLLFFFVSDAQFPRHWVLNTTCKKGRQRSW